MASSFLRMLPPALLLAALGLSLPAGAQMYKWVDERGVVSYSNAPPPGMQGKKVDVIEDRVSVYTPDPLINRAMGEEAIGNKRAARLEAQLEAERRARASAQAAAQATASSAAARRQAAYERCVSERRVECDSIRAGTPSDASYGYNSYYGPAYIVGARGVVPAVPFQYLDVPNTRIGVSTAPPVGISTTPKIGIDERPPVGAQPASRSVGRFR